MTMLKIHSVAIVVLICGAGLVSCAQTNSQDGLAVGVEKLPQTGLEAHAEREGLTAAQCQEQGGSVIGDIGNGAIHRADYLCASGKKPVGSIVYGSNDSMPVEGAVCCT